VKKTMRWLAAVLAVLIVVSCLAACGGGGGNPAAGTYKGLYTKFVGDDDDAKNTEDEFTLILNADGKGTHKRDGEEFKVTWTLDGENFAMTETFLGLSIEYTGTLVGNRLDIFNDDPENIFTCEYVYEKQ